MTSVTQTDIRKTFDQALLGLLPFLGLDNSDVAWANKAFKPKSKRGYLRSTLLAGETRQSTFGDNRYIRLTGVYQIDVCGVKDTGLAWNNTMSDAIIDAYSLGMVFDCCGSPLTVGASYVTPEVYDDNRTITPVSIVYFCYTPQIQQRQPR